MALASAVNDASEASAFDRALAKEVEERITKRIRTELMKHVDPEVDALVAEVVKGLQPELRRTMDLMRDRYVMDVVVNHHIRPESP